MRIVGALISAATMAAATLLLAVPTAHADTGACISYLEDIGQDTTVRNQVCSTTEALGDAVSTGYAHSVCVPLMTVTGLAQEHAVRACDLAVAV